MSIEDYSGVFAAPTPLQAFGQAYQLGAGVRDDQWNNQRRQEAQQYLQAALDDKTGDPAIYSRAVVTNPDKFAGLTYAHKTMSNADKMAKVREILPSISALWNGQPGVAADSLDGVAEHYANGAAGAPAEGQPMQSGPNAQTYTPALRWSPSLNAPVPAAGQGPLPPPRLPPSPFGDLGDVSGYGTLSANPQAQAQPQAPAEPDDAMHVPRWPAVSKEDHQAHADGYRSMAKFIRAEPGHGRALATMTLASILADDPDSWNRIMSGIIKNNADLDAAPYDLRSAAATARTREAQADSAVADAATEPQRAQGTADQATGAGMTSMAEGAQAPRFFRGRAEQSEAAGSAARTEAAFAPKVARGKLALNDAQIRDIDSQIDDRDKQRIIQMQTLGVNARIAQAKEAAAAAKLPDITLKNIDAAGAAAQTSGAQADQFDQMADDVRDADLSGALFGAGGKAAEVIKQVFGAQDDITSVKQRIARLSNTAAIRAYKSAGATGNFSNIDLQTALKGVPKDGSRSAVWESYFRGIGMMARLDSIDQGARAEWLAKNEHMASATQDMEIDGVHVAKGTTYAQFWKSYLPTMLKARADQQAADNAAHVAGRSYASHGY